LSKKAANGNIDKQIKIYKEDKWFYLLLMSNLKRKRNCLSIDDKLNIIKELESGQSYTLIQEKYGIGKSTISDIKSKKNQLKEYATSNDGKSTHAKKLKSGTDSLIDDAVYLWFSQQREKGKPFIFF